MSKSYFIPIDISIYRTKSFIAVNLSNKELKENLIRISRHDGFI
jgi:hypothetical protein